MKKFITLSSFIFSIIILTGCNQSPSTNQPPIPPIENNIDQPIAQLSNLQTYRNPTYGYTLNHPSNWFAYTSNDADVFFQPNSEETGKIPGPHAQALEIKVQPQDPNQSLSQIAQAIYDQAGVTFSQETISIGGENGLKTISQCDGLGCGQPMWFVTKNNYTYTFNSSLGNKSDFEKIIASFQFNQ